VKPHFAALILLILPGFAPSAWAQNDAPAIWKGVFSQAQADRGRTVLETHCVRCHAPDRDRALAGEIFELHWGGRTVDRLFRKMRETMPPKQVSMVSDADKLDALAAVLEQNGFPPGEKDLTGDETTLVALRMLPREGPLPMKTGMFVEVIGCLSQDPKSTWLVTNATDPVPSSLDDPALDPQRAAAAALGSQTVPLLYPSPDPAPHRGKKVRVQGLLIRNTAGDRINMIALTPLAADCHP
jgi:mono/diheme cytochrome c family protein